MTPDECIASKDAESLCVCHRERRTMGSTRVESFNIIIVLLKEFVKSSYHRNHPIEVKSFKRKFLFLLQLLFESANMRWHFLI